MEWWIVLLFIFGGLVLLMMTGLPVAFCFLVVAATGIVAYWGVGPGLRQLTISLFESLRHYSLLPLPLFILMGEVMFRSKLASEMMDTVDKLMGRLPGRMGLTAVAGGALMSTLSGSGMATTAVLGEVLVPQMQERGYSKAMSLGPILGSGGLAVMIPPSILGVFLAVVAEISIGKLLMAIIFPGILMAAFYAAYIILRCWLQPSVAPPYTPTMVSFIEKVRATIVHILPMGFIVFSVTGVIFLGIATPSEAAATGTVAAFILAAVYGRLNWKLVKEAGVSTTKITVMIFMIIAVAKAYSQILAYSGASRGLIDFSLMLPVDPIFIIVGLQVVLLFMGMFMTTGAIIMIVAPIALPLILKLGFDPVWFGAIFLLNTEMAMTSPPYGVSLFVMKGVAPPGTTMADCYKAALPFLGCDLIVMALIIAFPQIALWLPHAMR